MIGVFAESVKRLYKDKKITLDNVKKLYADGYISKEEYTYIKKEEAE